MLDDDDIWRAIDGGDRHPCVIAGCTAIVEYDDEPWCFAHSPDSGSSVLGYSYRKEHHEHTSDRGN